ncbi:hypothetical protein ACSXAY_12885 [Clostridium perfringens]
MKLSVDQLQKLSILFQRIYLKDSIKPKLVISFNNSLWTGDFTILEGSDYLTDVEKPDSVAIDVSSFFNEFKFSSIPRDIKTSCDSILLNYLTNSLLKTKTSDLNLSPYLFNAVNLETKFKLPFIYLDKTATYELVSVITETE